MKPDRRRWIMIALVFFATVINYLDRQTLSVVAPMLRDEFGMTNTAYGRVIFAFMLAYTISNGFSGVFIDRVGTKLGYAACMLWWSIATVLHAFTTGALSLGVYRFLLGIGEAGNWPGGVKVVSEWFPERERALASGLFNSGSAIGAILAPPVIVWAVFRFGWPASFIMVGASGMAWLVLWSLIYRTPAARLQSFHGNRAQKPIPVMDLLRANFVWRFTVAKIFLDPVWYFYIFWFPEYLRRARGFDMASIGKYAWIPFAVAGAGNLLGGALSAALLKRGVRVHVARRMTVVMFTLSMTAAIPAVMSPSAGVSIACISIAMLGYTGCSANMLAAPADQFPPSSVGSIWGLASMGSGFGGMVFSLLTGWAVDNFSYTPVFIGFGLMPLICAAIFWTAVQPRPRSGDESQHAYPTGSTAGFHDVVE